MQKIRLKWQKRKYYLFYVKKRKTKQNIKKFKTKNELKDKRTKTLSVRPTLLIILKLKLIIP